MISIKVSHKYLMGLHMLGKLRTHLTKLGFGIFLVIVAMPGKSQAQVVPDGTLKSAVEQMQELMKINGGLREGNNLFHSFQEFSVPEGVEASFQNALDIENIFTRVTGDSVSNIEGILSAQGGANLFLMNPNGIVFGQNASINIGGSFIATTADSIQFGDGIELTANPSDEPPLLTNHIPIGLGFGSKKYSGSGAIEVNGAGNEITPSSPGSPIQIESNEQGLSVEPGNTLGLIGSNVSVDGGTLNTEDGNIEIGSVGLGAVGIQSTENRFTFNYHNVDSYQDINIANQALLNATGQGERVISLSGSDVTFKDGSLALITNQEASTSGSIEVNATETLTLLGTSPDKSFSSIVRSQTISSGKGSDINISTENLVVRNSGIISTITYANGLGGNLKIDATGSINLEPDPQTDLIGGFGSTTFGSGDAGNIQISAQQLRIANGESIGSPTLGEGNGGDVKVQASSIELFGTNNSESSLSSIFASSASTGNAGNVTVDTSQLRIIDGANINSASIANGNAGNVTINASESIEVAGQSQSTTEPISSTISSSVAIPNEVFQQVFGLTSDPSGQAGNVTVNTPILNIDEGGTISVRNEGIGDAGTLSINGGNVNLDNSGSITAASASGTGGNIELQISDLEIDDGSQITTEAGNQGGGGNININATNITAKKNSLISADAIGGNGGNITIDSETILGLQNSDITANAIEGDGGNINITTRTIQGFEEQAELTSGSDITASSEFGRSGTVTINSPETNSEEDLELSAKGVESVQSLEFFSACGKGKGRLTRTGMGVPENPDRWFHDVDSVRVYEEAKKTVQAERIKQGLRNGSPEEVYRRELELIRSRRNKSGNRHNSLAYEVDYARGRQPMIVPAPKGEFVQPEGYSEYTANGKPIPIFYSQTNEVPPASRVRFLRKEFNVVQINPDGTQHFIRMTLAQDVKEQMCTDAQQVIKVGQ